MKNRTHFKRGKTIEEYLFNRIKVNKKTGCWLWQMGLDEESGIHPHAD